MPGTDSIQLCCAQCGAINRVPRARVREQPRCGRCHGQVCTGSPVPLTGENFDAHVARGDVPVVVDFWAPWCGPCLAMAPAFDSAAQALEPSLRLGKVNTEEQPELASRYAIRSIPTLVMFHRGRELARQSGALTGAALMAWIRGNVPSY